ncbi:MAG: glycosyltransferase family 2 protein, partial [Bdellovibrionaceae bacterium]|nr:glycosyltransferase family 2 protein [Bdellovibrio sp.]
LVPVLDEGSRITDQVIKMKEFAALVDIFIVDGGSTDDALRPDFLRNNLVRSLLVNRGTPGLSAQLRVGLAEILNDNYQGIILIDGNGKDNLEALPRFIEKLERGYDHVQGSRFIAGARHQRTPWLRWFAIRFLHAPLLSLASGRWLTDTTNGFRAYSRLFLLDPRIQPFRDIFSKYELHYYLTIRAARLGFKSIEIPVERSYPANEKTPTKIKGLAGYRTVLATLIKACVGRFNP